MSEERVGQDAADDGDDLSILDELLDADPDDADSDTEQRQPVADDEEASDEDRAPAGRGNRDIRRLRSRARKA